MNVIRKGCDLGLKKHQVIQIFLAEGVIIIKRTQWPPHQLSLGKLPKKHPVHESTNSTTDFAVGKITKMKKKLLIAMKLNSFVIAAR